MKITTEAQHANRAITIRIAQVTIDIDAAERRAREIEPNAEQSESAKKALAAVRLGIDRAKKIRDSLTVMERTLRAIDESASVELNDNECSLLGYVNLTST